MARLQEFSANTHPLFYELKAPADDLGPTVRDLGDLAPDLERLFRNVDPLVSASRSGVPAAERFLAGAEPVLESVHVLMPELNPTLAYLSFARRQIGHFFSAPAATLAGTGEGGYRGNGAGEHYLPQAAIIDTRSLMRRPGRPFWERANAYHAPNAYERGIGLGVIENFDCRPNGGEQRNPSGSGVAAEPP
jgi:phospholipid/cholesterol/gamma-HCH transport system substrate-binding protein